MIKKVILQPYWYEMYCDECGTLMDVSSVNNHTNPPEYIYRCEKCGHLALTTKNLGVTRNSIIEAEVVDEEDIND